MITTLGNRPQGKDIIPDRWYKKETGTWDSDQDLDRFYDPMSPTGSIPLFKIAPRTFRSLLNWIKDRYNNPEVIVTENGICSSRVEEEASPLQDTVRTKFFRDHIAEMFRAISEDGCRVTGYLPWCLLDAIEWSAGNE
jgi:beta-glucosidase/6-phospho-beta-glucosidase/beta-galactosidase